MDDITGKNIRVHIQETASVVTEYVYEIDGTELSKRMESSDEDVSQEAREIKMTLDSLTKGDRLSESEMLQLNNFCLDNAKMIDNYQSDADDVEIVDSYLERGWLDYQQLKEEMEKEMEEE